MNYYEPTGVFGVISLPTPFFPAGTVFSFKFAVGLASSGGRIPPGLAIGLSAAVVFFRLAVGGWRLAVRSGSREGEVLVIGYWLC